MQTPDPTRPDLDRPPQPVVPAAETPEGVTWLLSESAQPEVLGQGSILEKSVQTEVDPPPRPLAVALQDQGLAFEPASDDTKQPGRDCGPPDLVADQRPVALTVGAIRPGRRPLGRMATFGALGLVGIAAAVIGVTTFADNPDKGRRAASVKIGPLEEMPDLKNGVPELARPKTVRLVPTTAAPAAPSSVALPSAGSPGTLPPGPAAAALAAPLAPLPGGFAPASSAEPPVVMSAARPVELRPAPALRASVAEPVAVPVETKPVPVRPPATADAKPGLDAPVIVAAPAAPLAEPGLLVTAPGLPAPALPVVAALAPPPVIETTGGLSDGAGLPEPSLLGKPLPVAAPLPPPAPSRVATLRPERPAAPARVRSSVESAAAPVAPGTPAVAEPTDDDSVEVFGLKVPMIGAAGRSIRNGADALVDAVTGFPGKL